MSTLATIEAAARGLLAAVFVVSGSSKLAHPFAVALALTRFHVLRRVHIGLGRLVGAFEIFIALSLVAVPFSEAGLTMAAITLAFFTYLIARALVRGERFSCACFGAHGEAIGLLTLARATALLLIAVVGTAAASVAAVPSWSELAVGLAVGLLIVSQSLLIAALLRAKPFSWSIEVEEGVHP